MWGFQNTDSHEMISKIKKEQAIFNFKWVAGFEATC